MFRLTSIFCKLDLIICVFSTLGNIYIFLLSLTRIAYVFYQVTLQSQVHVQLAFLRPEHCNLSHKQSITRPLTTECSKVQKSNWKQNEKHWVCVKSHLYALETFDYTIIHCPRACICKITLFSRKKKIKKAKQNWKKPKNQINKQNLK